MIYGTPTIVTNGLVLYLDAANTLSYVSGSTTWNDLSGGGNIGTITPYIQPISYGFINNGIRLFGTINSNGGTSILTNNSSIYNATSNYTIDIGLLNIVSSSDEWIINNGLGVLNGTQTNYAIRKITSKYRFYISDGTNISQFDSNSNVNTNNTNLVITFTYNGNINFYINGVLDRSVSNPYVSTTSTRNRVEIGGGQLGGGNIRFFDGIFYNIKLYNRALSPSEITQNYNALKSRFNLT